MDSEEKIDKVMLERITKDFFDDTVVTYTIGMEGQRTDEDKRIVLGCRAGPSVSVTNLLHEMSHLAEREKNKIAKRPAYNWDFSYGKYWEVLGQSGWEPQTDQSVKRELRVWAFQLSIQNHYGINEADEGETIAEDLVASAVYLSAWCYWRKSVGECGLESDKDALRRAADHITELSNSKFTFARFQQDWEDRIKLLKG